MTLSDPILIEVAIETPDDAVAAQAGGANRLELCSALDLGGLTPTIGTFLEVRARTKLPIFVMIRSRGGDFVYSEAEFDVMVRDLELFLPYNPDGFVFGTLQSNGMIDITQSSTLVMKAAGKPCVFHRAFDRVPDYRVAMEHLIALGFQRILTSGRESTGLAGASEIAKLVKMAADRIEILPCGQIRSKSVVEIVQITDCKQVHASFAERVPEQTGRGHRGYNPRSRTSQTEVLATRQAVDLFRLGIN